MPGSRIQDSDFFLQGFEVEDGQIELYSTIITNMLGIPCASLVGANVAQNIAQKEFAEATIGMYIWYNSIRLQSNIT